MLVDLSTVKNMTEMKKIYRSYMCDYSNPHQHQHTTTAAYAIPAVGSSGEIYYNSLGNFANKEQGNNPMNTTFAKTDAVAIAPTAVATVTAAVSDEQKKVKYLTDRARSTYFNLEDKLYAQFNLNVNNAPKTYKELVDAIKGDKFKIDPIVELKLAAGVEDFKFRTPFYGIIWDGPQPDRKGYDKAAADLRGKFREVQDVINVKSADEGLAALQDFEKWVPAGLPN